MVSLVDVFMRRLRSSIAEYNTTMFALHVLSKIDLESSQTLVGLLNY